MFYFDFQTRDNAERQYESLAKLARENTTGETKGTVSQTHHMNNGTMFKDIIKYKDETFF